MRWFKNIRIWWHSLSVLHKSSLTLFLVVLALSRFYLLDKIPVGIHYDELVYMIQAKAMALSGSDLAGFWNPWRLMPLTDKHAELTTPLFVPGFWLFSNPLLAGKVVSAFLGATFPFIMGWLAWNLWRNQRIAWLTVLVTAFNPWVWQLSRMSFDPLPGLWFGFLATAIITAYPPRVLYQWLAFPLFFLSFFQYQGYKILFVPWLVIWAYYGWKIQKSLSKKMAIGLAAFAVGVFALWYAVLLPSQAASQRNQKTIFFDPAFKDQLIQNVSTDRRLSLDNPLLAVTHNKAQALGQYLVKRYISNFDPSTLFVSGEPNLSPFSVWSKGFFYLIDLPLFIFGLYQLAARKKWRQALLVWVGLFLIMPLPRLLTTVNEWMIFRGSIGYMLMLFPIAIGLHFLTQQQWLKWAVLGLYGLFIAQFAYDYFYRYPLYSANGLYLEQRVLASYLDRQSAETPITVFTEFPEFLFYSYLYYNQLVTVDSLPVIRENLRNGQSAYQQVRFTDECLPPLDTIDGITIAERGRPHCRPAGLDEQTEVDLSLSPETALSISSLLDSGEIFWIYQDTLCQQTGLNTFIDVSNLAQLQMETLPDPQFCELWIKDLSALRQTFSH